VELPALPGKTGAIVAMVMMLISPYMLYYGRYVRNEAYAALSGVVLVWGMLRYMETGKARYTYWVTLATVLHFTAKETSFIYTAQALLFLGLYLVFRMTQKRWDTPRNQIGFFTSFIAGILLLGVAGIVGFIRNRAGCRRYRNGCPRAPG